MTFIKLVLTLKMNYVCPKFQYNKMKKNIVIFASGNGSNAQRIINFFKKDADIQIVSIFCNNPKAFVIDRAKLENIPYRIFSKTEFNDSNIILNEVQSHHPDLIVLAGFLWLIPKSFIQHFPNKIINLHPALLPKYGGKGMYGHHVHQAVLQNKETESGITIHYVNEEYDKGDVLLQAKCRIEKNDTIETLSARIHDLEYEHLPKIIEKLLK